MAKITGNTFPHRNYLRTVGNWNGVGKYWTVPDVATDYLDAIRRLGLTVTLDGDNTPKSASVENKPINYAPRAGNNLIAPVETTATTEFYGSDRTYFNAFALKNPLVFMGFRSLGELCDTLESIAKPASDGNREAGWETSSFRMGFSGTASMTAAINLARNGWSDGVTMAQEAMNIIETDHAKARKRLYSVAGGRVNVGKMLSGNPMHMSRRARQPAKKVVTLFVEVIMSASITNQNAILRAASIGAMADLLELNGYACEIVAVYTTRRHEHYTGPVGSQFTVTIKQAGDVMNLSDLVFALGHPSMCRRLMFGLFGISNRNRDTWKSMGKLDRPFVDLPSNSFGIEKLTIQDQDKVRGATFADKVRAIFPLIVPDNFPVTLK